MGQYVDLTGQKFGRLTVLYKAPSRVLPSGQKQTMWHCRCDCGIEKDIRGAHLTAGRSKSCGCLNKEAAKERSFIDMTGYVMSEHGVKDSKLTVIKQVDDYIDPHGNHRIQWLCHCECGNETIILGTQLRSGRTKTCGHCGYPLLEGTKGACDLKGKVFGKLLVVEQADKICLENNNTIYTWRCKCECGNETIVRGWNLISGHTQSCGHCSFELIDNTRRIDLNGKKFSRLTVMRQAGSSLWLCKCNCGNEIVAHTTKLITGVTTSCGCLRSEKISKAHLVDLTGWVMKEHGVPDSKLTVIKRAKDYVRSNGQSNPQYLCQCECGNKCVVDAYYLKTGHTKSCGCQKSFAEYNLVQFFTDNNIEFEYQKKFDDLVGLGKHHLSYDFYLPQFNMLIECQGQQHFFPIEIFGGSDYFVTQKQHDQLKIDYAEKNHYNLLSIGYWDYKNIINIITEYMKIFGGN